jgi:hypothetical protein
MIIIDESHNLNKKNPTKQELNLRGMQGVPKLVPCGDRICQKSEIETSQRRGRCCGAHLVHGCC